MPFSTITLKAHRLAYQFFALSILSLFLTACPATTVEIVDAAEEPVEFTILQINDVYEIAPISGGKVGGLARVGGVLRQLEAENPNTIAVLAGDFLSPSFMGTLEMENDEPIAGLQMVETLNAMGLDYATFGNHEFDLKTGELLEKRIDASEFEYMSVNAQFVGSDRSRRAFRQNGKDVPPYSLHTINQNGKSYELAIVGVVLPFNKKDYVDYRDVNTSFGTQVKMARAEADIVIGLTHLSVDGDEELAKAVPGLPLFMGGHEHHQLSRYVGETAITKADANAKTVYVHRLTYYPSTELCRVVSEIVPINEETPEDEVTAAVVAKWQGKMEILVERMGYDLYEVLDTLDEKLIGTEVFVRSSQTNYGQLTNEAIATAWPGADAYVFNSGSLRIDDDISGIVTTYDVLRSFPFGGPMVQLSMTGSQLQQMLDTGETTNQGEGGYLQRFQAEKQGGQWQINGQALVASNSYKVVMPSFLAGGGEANLGFLGDITAKEERDDFSVGADTVKNDIRDIVIHYFKTRS